MPPDGHEKPPAHLRRSQRVSTSCSGGLARDRRECAGRICGLGGRSVRPGPGGWGIRPLQGEVQSQRFVELAGELTTESSDERANSSYRDGTYLFGLSL